MQLRHTLLFVLYLFRATLADNLIELSCITDKQCEDFENSNCMNSTCICMARDSDKHVDCQPKYEKLTNIIGGQCPCTQPHATCDEKAKQCFCDDGYIPSADKRRCLSKNVPLDGECELSSQCELNSPFTLCNTDQKRCRCKEHFAAHQGSCLSLLDLNCSSGKNCSSSGSLCLPQLKKCACKVNLVQNLNKTVCMPPAVYGEACATSPQCQQLLGVGGYCKANQCACRPKYYASSMLNTTQPGTNHTICVPVVAYGAYCHYDQDCQHKNQLERSNMTMQCRWGECHCREYHQVVGNEICVPLPSAANSMIAYLPQILLICTIFRSI